MFCFYSPVSLVFCRGRRKIQCIMATTSTNTLQSDGASSSLSTNKRGRTRGKVVKKVRKHIEGGRLTVEFCSQFRQAIGPHAQKFNNECGIICRMECPFNFMDWRKVPKSVKASLRERILMNFDVDLSSEIVVDVIDFQMGRSFKNYRAKLQEHFLKCNGKEDIERAKGLKPTDSNLDDDAWHILCEYWSSEKFHVMSTKNSENRGKRKYVSLNGTVSTPNHHFRDSGTADPPIGEIETFRKLHYKEKVGWVNDYSRSAYENMAEIKQQAGSCENPPGDLDIMQQVLGKRSAYIRGWSRVPSTRSDSMNSRHSTGSSSRLSHSEMSSRLATTESELASTKLELASTKAELESTKSEFANMRGEMANLSKMVMSFVSGKSVPSISDNGSETRA